MKTKIKNFRKNQMVEVYVNRDEQELKQSLLVLAKPTRWDDLNICIYNVLTQDGEIEKLLVEKNTYNVWNTTYDFGQAIYEKVKWRTI